MAVETKELKIKTTELKAWYILQIPVSYCLMEHCGLAGLILEVSAGNTVMLYSKIVIDL